MGTARTISLGEGDFRIVFKNVFMGSVNTLLRIVEDLRPIILKHKWVMLLN
jgi:hypothetical protein